MTRRTRTMLTYVAMGALLYWWFWKRPTPMTPEQLAYQRDLGETQL